MAIAAEPGASALKDIEKAEKLQAPYQVQAVSVVASVLEKLAMTKASIPQDSYAAAEFTGEEAVIRSGIQDLIKSANLPRDSVEVEMKQTGEKSERKTRPRASSTGSSDAEQTSPQSSGMKEEAKIHGDAMVPLFPSTAVALGALDPGSDPRNHVTGSRELHNVSSNYATCCPHDMSLLYSLADLFSPVSSASLSSCPSFPRRPLEPHMCPAVAYLFVLCSLFFQLAMDTSVSKIFGDSTQTMEGIAALSKLTSNAPASAKILSSVFTKLDRYRKDASDIQISDAATSIEQAAAELAGPLNAHDLRVMAATLRQQSRLWEARVYQNMTGKESRDGPPRVSPAGMWTVCLCSERRAASNTSSVCISFPLLLLLLVSLTLLPASV